jgi:hypothetical protein
MSSSDVELADGSLEVVVVRGSVFVVGMVEVEVWE